ncbi:E3 ubiquitin-protein ligase RNF182 isoform X3 [Zonotrichia albicollis]|uniref:E3 ubiquitin-protein ligase RNF182 isoform X3 n=1 Tax=Zonotrichia albicollis TaxID=44394 RepID=UPI003D80B6D4
MGVPWAPAAVGSLLGVRVYLCVCFGDKSPRGGGEPARGCSEPRNHIPVRECSRGEGGEAPSQPPAGLGGAGGRLPAEEEEEKARIFLNERLAPRPTPPPGSRLPPPSRHSPVSLRGAASFYSDGAEPRLFRVVTKPAGAPRRGCGGKRCRCRGHPTGRKIMKIKFLKPSTASLVTSYTQGVYVKERTLEGICVEEH